MRKHVTPTFFIWALAACQSAAPVSSSGVAWKTQLEATQAELTREVKALHALLAVQLPEPRGDIELAAAIASLGDRVDQLGGVVSHGAKNAQAVRAASSSGATKAPLHPGFEREIEALKQALLFAEKQRATHLENIANAGVAGYKRRTVMTAAREPA